MRIRRIERWIDALDDSAGTEPNAHTPRGSTVSLLDAAGTDPVPAAPAPGQLCLVRHGETEWSRNGRHTGITDVPLTPMGEKQARALAPLLAGVRPATVFTSPRSRAIRTAELAGLADVCPIVATEDMAEWAYGDYEGVTTVEIRKTRPGWTIWTGDPPGGETAAEVGARADRMLARIRAALQNGPVVTVGHGHFSRVLAARWLDLPVADGALFVLGPASPCLLGQEHGRPAVHRWNVPNPAERDPG
jgi:broad specificity phosphatase PhoE